MSLCLFCVHAVVHLRMVLFCLGCFFFSRNLAVFEVNSPYIPYKARGRERGSEASRSPPRKGQGAGAGSGGGRSSSSIIVSLGTGVLLWGILTTSIVVLELLAAAAVASAAQVTRIAPAGSTASTLHKCNGS